VVVAVTPAGGAIGVLLGSVLLRLTLSGSYQRYVREGMRPWLLIAGVAIIAVGLYALVRTAGRGHRAGEPGHTHGHEHGHAGEGIGVGWLLLAPVAALLLVAPPALGSYGVDRAAKVDVSAGDRVFDPLPSSENPYPLSLLDFSQRGFDGEGQSMDGRTVALTGFVAGEVAGGFKLARYQIACCAADAEPVVVIVRGTFGEPPSRDQWVTVTGTYRPGGGDFVQIEATSVVQIPAPNDPYE
jgi:uncharacterized repeat protein (TIGR03943 family)